jgi:Lar family restriction alleviation protein
MGAELKPCPFCGGHASIARQDDADGFGLFLNVACRTCRASTAQQYASNGNDCPQTYAEVRAAWNGRASPSPSSGKGAAGATEGWPCMPCGSPDACNLLGCHADGVTAPVPTRMCIRCGQYPAEVTHPCPAFETGTTAPDAGVALPDGAKNG